MSYLIENVKANCLSNFLEALPQEAHLHLGDYPVDLGDFGEHELELLDVEVDVRDIVTDIFNNQDFESRASVRVTTIDLLEACQDACGYTHLAAANRIISDVLEWLEEETKQDLRSAKSIRDNRISVLEDELASLKKQYKQLQSAFQAK